MALKFFAIYLAIRLGNLSQKKKFQTKFPLFPSRPAYKKEEFQLILKSPNLLQTEGETQQQTE